MGKVSEETVMPTQAQIRDEVTQRIVQALESNLLPWRRPWRAGVGGSQPGRHSNVVSGKAYRGINPVLLELHGQRLELLSRWWGTFNQWHQIGCRIRRRPQGVEEGHWGCRIVFWKPIAKTVLNAETGTEEDEERFFILKTFTVFSADQVEGEAAAKFQVYEDQGQPYAEPDFQPAEELIAATGADIRHGGDHAYYKRPLPAGSFPNHREGDFIVVPPRATFNPPGAFYESVVHELGHWAEVRTGWDHEKQGYALGELAAEIASCYVATELGIPQGEGLGNHAAYLKSWLDALRNDRNFIFKAAKQASKVTDYLLSFVTKPEPEAVGAAQ
jgi:antirestriction protein ArdC